MNALYQTKTRKRMGLCSKCGQPLKDANYRTCEKCRDKNKKYYQDNKERYTKYTSDYRKRKKLMLVP